MSQSQKKNKYFLGDSNTREGYYLKYLEMMALTSEPEVETEFANYGIGGDTAGHGLIRLDLEGILADRPQEVYVMFGSNDLNAAYYSDEATYTSNEANRNNAMNISLSNMEMIVRKLSSAGINPTLMTPVSYEHRESFTVDGAASIRYNYTEAKKTFAEKVKSLAGELNVPVIDVNTWMNGLQDELFASGISSDELGFCLKDRIHLTEMGAMAAALGIAKEAGIIGGVVSDVEIDAENMTVTKQIDATITQLTNEAGVLSFNYLPVNLPMAVTDGYNTILAKCGFDITSNYNRELLKISGLDADAAYTLKIGENVIGEFTGTELETGINLAVIAENPAQKQAQSVLDLLEEKRKASLIIRSIARSEVTMKKAGIDITDSAAVSAWVANQSDSDHSKYPVYKEAENTHVNTLNEKTIQARKAAQPVMRKVTLEKAN